MKKEPKGIGGWLFLYFITTLITALAWIGVAVYGIVLTIQSYFLVQETHNTIREIIAMGGTPTYMGGSLYMSLFVMFFYSVIPLLLGLSGLIGLYLIIKKEESAIECARTFMGIQIILFMIALIASIFSFNILVISLFILINIIFIAWMIYFKRSVRVKNTFVK